MMTPAGSFVILGVAGTALTPAEIRLFRRYQVAAVCLFRRNLVDQAQTLALTTQLREVLGDDGLIAIDQEGGSVVRTWFLPHPPAAMGLGKIDDTAISFAAGELTGRGLASLGINWNFAPVLDLNNNPNNIVIGMRSFGSDVAGVIQHSRAWLQGLESMAVAGCIKHFPGHGDTHIDSHVALPTVDKPLAQLRQFELAPFAALSHEAPSLMTAHIRFSDVDQLPATLSPRWLQDILRQEIGFKGVVITDALEMKAIATQYGVHPAAIMALAAGVDMVTSVAQGEDAAQLLAAIDTAQREGALSSAEMQHQMLQKLQRISLLRQRYRSVPTEYNEAAKKRDYNTVLEIARRALRVVPDGVAPARQQTLQLWLPAESSGDGISEAGISAASLQQQLAGLTAIRYITMENFQPTGAVPAGGVNVLVSTARARYSPAECAAIQSLLSRVPFAFHIVLWNPFQVVDVPLPALITWGYAPPCIAALREWLSGAFIAPSMPLSALIGNPK